MDEGAINEAVLRFRKAMEGCHSQLGTTFEMFPRGCCGDVAELLAAYLKDEGFGVFEYVSGRCVKRGSSHAWLEKNGVIIDATDDQFEGESNSAMVTGDRSFHSQFNENTGRRPDGDFRLVGGAIHLSSAYACLKRFID